MKTRLIWDRVAMELVTPVEYARRQDDIGEMARVLSECRPADILTRGRWVYDRGTNQLVDAADYYANKPAPRRSHLASPSIHGDFNDYVLCPADGVRYGSKGDYRAALRRNGCVEVGNEKIHTKPGKAEFKSDGVRDDIKRTMSQLGVAA